MQVDRATRDHAIVQRPQCPMRKTKSTRRGDLMRHIAALQIELDRAGNEVERQRIKQQIAELTKLITAP